MKCVILNEQEEIHSLMCHTSTSVYSETVYSDAVPKAPLKEHIVFSLSSYGILQPSIPHCVPIDFSFMVYKPPPKTTLIAPGLEYINSGPCQQFIVDKLGCALATIFLSSERIKDPASQVSGSFMINVLEINPAALRLVPLILQKTQRLLQPLQSGQQQSQCHPLRLALQSNRVLGFISLVCSISHRDSSQVMLKVLPLKF
ncbi:hypothetical protein FGO68_gene2104 [Halteria grandinella]|uniref:Uncharacterized protein n=1 Tax=Halteria grandinella TaxID=5974 RepID=A0A8J8NJ71_HALGN|nr:hypothetical protein FGO68_gene2104 [Halteria grandinella]